MTIAAALLDATGVFLRMDQLASAEALTALHLPQITACDLPPGKYRWIADAGNPYGGAFWSVHWLDRVERDRVAVEAETARIARREELRNMTPAERLRARRADRNLARGN